MRKSTVLTAAASHTSTAKTAAATPCPVVALTPFITALPGLVTAVKVPGSVCAAGVDRFLRLLFPGRLVSLGFPAVLRS